MNMQAQAETGAPAMPGLNQPAPAFRANTTRGEKLLSDYEGRWLVKALQTSDQAGVASPEN